MSKPAITAISLGWGLQSWTLAAMVALKELPPVDFAIHSDTTHERQATYEFAERMTPWLEDNGVKVITVDDREQAQKVTTSKTDIPAFTIRPDGKKGMLRRQCTSRWKIMPMRQYASQELKQRGLKKTPGIIEQWLGITTDEWTRAKDSDVKYITHRFPLLELDMSRQDCTDWLRDNKLPVPVKSSCVFCPYHNKAAWEEMRREGGADWEKAVSIDEAIRNVRAPFALFVHNKAIPLVDAVAEIDLVQPDMWSMDDEDAECDSGYCFL